jgi:TPP-dependent pyruvate/acetoin dehydrogenase alpha subunit
MPDSADRPTSSTIDAGVARALLSRMWLIRAFEETVSTLYAQGRLSGIVHLGIGLEATTVGSISRLSPEDRVFAGHRAHSHALAKGASPTRLLAELAGRDSGYCGGKGGSMHIAAPEVGFVTATGIVGGSIPLALGDAWAATLEGAARVTMVFFGDGAAQTGSFHESLNLASLWRLPVVFVCENNGYAEFTPLSAHTKVERLANHASVYEIPARTVDGSDVFEVHDATGEALKRARTGGGPSFIEALIDRRRGHYEGDAAAYRDTSELADWAQRDPIVRFLSALADRGLVSDADAGEIESDVRAMMQVVTREALAGPRPAGIQLLRDVVADQ